MCQAFTQCFTQLYHVIFTTSVRGGCYCHPHFTHKETNAHRRQGHAQGHTSKSLAELGLQAGFKTQAHCTGLTCFLLQKHTQNLKIRSEEDSVVWQQGLPAWLTGPSKTASPGCVLTHLATPYCRAWALCGYTLTRRLWSKGYGFSAL